MHLRQSRRISRENITFSKSEFISTAFHHISIVDLETQRKLRVLTIIYYSEKKKSKQEEYDLTEAFEIPSLLGFEVVTVQNHKRLVSVSNKDARRYNTENLA